MTDLQSPLDTVLAEMERSLADRADDLVDLSHALHGDPELGYAEFHAAARITDLLRRNGFEIEPAPEGLPTAVVARAGTSPLVVALCVEYDALPEIGHGCGHNVNAACAVGAALALRPVVERLGLSVLVLGTPAEETAGGKVDLIERGCFEGVSFAMMAHAAPHDSIGTTSLAMTTWDVTFTGRPAHAAADPQSGLNAVSALLVAQTAIGLIRQELPPESIVSSVIVEGGSAVNVVPAHARMQVEMRSPATENLEVIKTKVRRCIEAGAHATGCTSHIGPLGNDYADLREDPVLADLYRGAMERRGRRIEPNTDRAGSTDMGNVSHLVPAIHPWIGVDADGVVLHTAEFAAAAITSSADRAIIDGAHGLAATAAAVALDPDLRARFSG